MAEGDSLENIARNAILHLLAIREYRRLRHYLQQKYTPNDSTLLDNWADEDMLGDKIVARVLSPQLKHYLLDQSVPRGVTLVDNPFYRPEMTADIVQTQMELLEKEHKIALIKPHVIRHARSDEDEESLGPRYRITDPGLVAAPDHADGIAKSGITQIQQLARRLKETATPDFAQNCPVK